MNRCALVLLLLCACKRDDPATSTARPVASVRWIDDDVVDAGLFVEPSGGYAVAFPVAPVASETEVDVPGFGKRKIHEQKARADKTHAYHAEYFDYGVPKGVDPSKITDEVVAKALGECVKESMEGWTNLDVVPISQDGVAGQDITAQRKIDSVTLTMRARFFMTRALRLYAVSSTFVGSSDQANAFIASFVIQKR